jgi:hypothetical protein
VPPLQKSATRVDQTPPVAPDVTIDKQPIFLDTADLQIVISNPNEL